MRQVRNRERPFLYPGDIAMSCIFLSRLNLLAVPLLWAVASSATAIEPFVLVDSNGKTIGPIIDMAGGDNGSARVPFRVGNQRITLVVSTSGLLGRGTLYYESTYCSGQAYMISSGGLLTDIVNGRYTAVVPDGPARLVTARSFHNEKEGECGRILQPRPYPYRLARELVDLHTRFTPPFRVEASDEVIDLDAPVR
jgi:hypothetical protein